MHVAIAEYDAAIRAREKSKMTRLGARLMMEYEFPAAWEVVRLMGVLIKRELPDAAELLGAWQAARLHAPRPPVKDPAKLLTSGSGTAVVVAGEGAGALQASVEAPTSVAAPEALALPAGTERPGLLRRVFRFLGKVA